MKTEKETVIHGTEKFNVALYEHNILGDRYFLYSHWHEEYEIIYMQHGNVTVDIDGTEYHLRANQALIVNSYVIHAVHPDNLANGKFVCIVFGEKFLFPDLSSDIYTEYFLSKNKNQMQLPTLISGKNDYESDILHKINLIVNCGYNQAPAYKLHMQIELLSIFYILYKENAFVDSSNHHKYHNLRIKEALSIIHQGYMENLQVSEIAQSLNVCTEYFIRSFKAAVGKTPKEYIVAYRVSKAFAMFSDTEVSIADIAAKCGFDDTSYFARCFKKIMGVTPTQYRNSKVICNL